MEREGLVSVMGEEPGEGGVVQGGQQGGEDFREHGPAAAEGEDEHGVKDGLEGGLRGVEENGSGDEQRDGDEQDG
jgi:hypothetical protein